MVNACIVTPPTKALGFYTLTTGPSTAKLQLKSSIDVITLPAAVVGIKIAMASVTTPLIDAPIKVDKYICAKFGICATLIATPTTADESTWIATLAITGKPTRVEFRLPDTSIAAPLNVDESTHVDFMVNTPMMTPPRRTRFHRPALAMIFHCCYTWLKQRWSKQ